MLLANSELDGMEIIVLLQSEIQSSGLNESEFSLSDRNCIDHTSNRILVFLAMSSRQETLPKCIEDHVRRFPTTGLIV